MRRVRRPPARMRQLHFEEVIGATIHAPEVRTCTSGVGRTLDYFVVCDELEHLVQSVTVLEHSITSPHLIVRMTMAK
eukprot:3982542-Amphidinium_carterae.2